MCKCLAFFFSNSIVSTEEWKKELAGYLIDYSSLDIKDTIASGNQNTIILSLGLGDIKISYCDNHDSECPNN